MILHTRKAYDIFIYQQKCLFRAIDIENYILFVEFIWGDAFESPKECGRALTLETLNEISVFFLFKTFESPEKVDE